MAGTQAPVPKGGRPIESHCSQMRAGREMLIRMVVPIIA
jgi:hypothetical protein